MPDERLGQYFNKQEGQYQVRKLIRDKVLFAPHNLLRDPPFSKLDLICCRNLLVHLNQEMQMHVLEMLHFSLNPGGVLFLGSSDSAEMTAHLFTPVNNKIRIYRTKARSRPPRYVSPILPCRAVIRATEPSGSNAATKQQFSYTEIHQQVLAQHSPPSVIINRESGIVHMLDRAGLDLRHAGGGPPTKAMVMRAELLHSLLSWQA